jgi:hypothetical protein
MNHWAKWRSNITEGNLNDKWTIGGPNTRIKGDMFKIPSFPTYQKIMLTVKEYV